MSVDPKSGIPGSGVPEGGGAAKGRAAESGVPEGGAAERGVPQGDVPSHRDPQRPWRLLPTIPEVEFEQPPGEVGMRELSRSTSRVLARAEAGERIVVWKRRDPIAVIFSAAEAQDFLLIHMPALVRMRLEGREAHGRGESVALDDLL